MSPAKRLSRKRFRALCERCKHREDRPFCRARWRRVERWMWDLRTSSMTNTRDVYMKVEAHARLAR